MKELINPAAWLLVLLGATLFGIRFGRLWGCLASWQKWGWRASAVGVILFYLAASQAGRAILEAGLVSSEDSPLPTVTCEYIFVLAGGYEIGVEPAHDMLVQETRRRVQAGVVWWRQMPGAVLVMAGAAQNSERSEARMVDLMANDAMAQGVPRNRIILESRSRNTRQHPQMALELPCLTRDSTIGIVTSAWHVKRARREFSRYFLRVISIPVPYPRHPAKPRSFVPNAQTLDESTTLLREYAALVWYALWDK